MPDANPVIASIPPQRETKQTNHLDSLKVRSLSRSWITTPGVAGLATTILRLPARALGGLIRIYQRTLSPALVVINPHGGCRFAPTCSHYAQIALQEHGLLGGIGLTIVRLAKCGPWHPGGDDPVPPSPRLRGTRSAQNISCVKVDKTSLAES